MAKILIVEDNEMNRDMLSRRLNRKGYETDIAIDGRKGVDAALASDYNIVLMDMSLPEIDGWEATQEIKKVKPDLPIIALTAHAMASDREKCLNAGCDDFDTKPVDFPRLLEKIKNLELK